MLSPSELHGSKRQCWSSFSIALSQTAAYSARPRIRKQTYHTVHSSSFTGIHCTYSHRDGQAELKGVEWLLTEVVYPPTDGHPSQYKLGRRTATMWIKIDALTLRHAADSKREGRHNDINTCKTSTTVALSVNYNIMRACPLTFEWHPVW